MYEKLREDQREKNLPDGIYFYASRKLCIGAAMHNETDLMWMRDKVRMYSKPILKDVFEFDSDSSVDDSEDQFWGEAMRRQDEIYNKSGVLREGYKRYIEDNGLSESEKKYVFVDMCSQGTSQYALAKEFFGSLYGLYFSRYLSDDNETMGRVETFLPQSSKIMPADNQFEFVFSSPEPVAKAFDSEGKLIFGKDARSAVEIEIMEKAQSKIMQYFCEFINIRAREECIGASIGMRLLLFFGNGAFGDAISVFSGRGISNDLLGSSDKAERIEVGC